jgi:hypothetical protein
VPMSRPSATSPGRRRNDHCSSISASRTAGKGRSGTRGCRPPLRAGRR